MPLDLFVEKLFFLRAFARSGGKAVVEAVEWAVDIVSGRALCCVVRGSRCSDPLAQVRGLQFSKKETKKQVFGTWI